jgi:uncharacterized protein (UPF0276 family)
MYGGNVENVFVVVVNLGYESEPFVEALPIYYIKSI